MWGLTYGMWTGRKWNMVIPYTFRGNVKPKRSSSVRRKAGNNQEYILFITICVYHFTKYYDMKTNLQFFPEALSDVSFMVLISYARNDLCGTRDNYICMKLDGLWMAALRNTKITLHCLKGDQVMCKLMKRQFTWCIVEENICWQKRW